MSLLASGVVFVLGSVLCHERLPACLPVLVGAAGGRARLVASFPLDGMTMLLGGRGAVVLPLLSLRLVSGSCCRTHVTVSVVHSGVSGSTGCGVWVEVAFSLL